ncbi:protein angel 2 [Trichuris trichiura]|uniref:Protein angel 2 n=1 Tax=Trichuris trichiura TaxID=36087 RepID=A0A077ZM16_TRITR|nr:protein angel 2 [Trichuris trichiura]
MKRAAETEMFSSRANIFYEHTIGVSAKVGGVFSEPFRKVRRVLAQHSTPFDETTHCNDAISVAGKGVVRTWRPVATCHRAELSSPALCSFTVCTYNILSQSCLESTAELYEKCEKKHLTWQHRSCLLLKELKTLNADIFCLQEVDHNTYSMFDVFFHKRKYKGVYKKRTGDKNDGCAVFWNRRKFSLVDSVAVEYFIPNTYVDRDNIGLLVKLRLKHARKSFCLWRRGRKQDHYVIVANTHLLYNPRRGDIKLVQLCQLLAHLQKMAKRYLENGEPFCDPIVLCGDMNCTPVSPMCTFLTSGRLEYANMWRNSISGLGPVGGPLLSYPIIPPTVGISELGCSFKVRSSPFKAETSNSPNFSAGTLAHSLSLSSAFDLHVPVEEKPVSTMVNGHSELVDFIFYGPSYNDISTQSKKVILNCTANSSLLTETQIMNTVGPLPNAYCGSDHLPLLAHFEYFQLED